MYSGFVCGDILFPNCYRYLARNAVKVLQTYRERKRDDDLPARFYHLHRLDKMPFRQDVTGFGRDIGLILYLYGELKQSRKIAAAIVKARQTKQIETIGDFLELVKPFFRSEREKKDLAKVFQALRIEVNHEMDALREMLKAATDMLRPGGRLVVITYHSLEDRIVKNLMKTGNVEGHEDKDFFGKVNTPFRLVNRQVIVPSDEEMARNPRSRSAKLRIAEKI